MLDPGLLLESGGAASTDPLAEHVEFLLAPALAGIADATGRHSLAVASGSPTLTTAVADPWGGDLPVVALGGGVLQIPDSDGLNTGTSYTAEWLLRLASASGSPVVFGQGNNAQANTAWQMQASGGTTNLVCWVVSAGGSWVQVGGTATLAANTWGNAALVVDGGTARFMLGGVQVGASATVAIRQNSTLPLVIGSTSVGGMYVGAVRLTRAARTPEQMMIEAPPTL